MSQDMPALERSLTFEHATSVINTYGVAVDEDEVSIEDECRDWFDMTAALSSDDADSIGECMTYLEWRGLLVRSALSPNIIAIKDEHEEQYSSLRQEATQLAKQYVSELSDGEKPIEDIGKQMRAVAQSAFVAGRISNDGRELRDFTVPAISVQFKS